MSFKVSALRDSKSKSAENKGKKRIIITTEQDMYVIPFSLGHPAPETKENDEEKEEDDD